MPPYIVSYRVRDDDDDTNSLPIYLPSTVLIANALDFATQFGALLDDVIGGQVVDATLALPTTMDVGNKADALANYEVEKGANLSFACANTNYRHTIRIPTWLWTLFNGKEISAYTQGGGGALNLFIDALVLGLTINGANVSPTDKYQNGLTAFLAGVKSHRTK